MSWLMVEKKISYVNEEEQYIKPDAPNGNKL